MNGGSLIRLAACPVQKAKETYRLIIGRLVDDAGGLAAPGARPEVWAYPGQQGLNVAASLREYAAHPDTSPTTAAFFTQFLPVVDAGMASLLRAGEVPCLVVGIYQVVAAPDDHDADRPAELYTADGVLVHELHLGPPR